MGHLEEALCRLYRSERLSHIDFWIGGLHIRQQSFLDVAGAIEANHITCHAYRSPTLAVYDSRHDDLGVASFRGELTAQPNLLIAAVAIHEGVHASCDIHRARQTDPVTEEVAGYIAQTCYARRAAGTTRRLIAGQDASEDRIFDTVHTLCVDMGLFEARRQPLARADIQAAREAVLGYRAYANLRGRTTSPYHDGLARSRSCGFLGLSRCEPPSD